MLVHFSNNKNKKCMQITDTPRQVFPRLPNPPKYNEHKNDHHVDNKIEHSLELCLVYYINVLGEGISTYFERIGLRPDPRLLCSQSCKPFVAPTTPHTDLETVKLGDSDACKWWIRSLQEFCCPVWNQNV